MARTTSVLVYGELSEVAHELLARKDLDLRWSMTLEEAFAVTRSVPIQLVLTSDPYAFSYLKRRSELPRNPPCIVVLGPESDGRETAYLEAGATAVAHRDTTAILAAMSELTGLAFRMHPRAAIETVVDVLLRGESYYLSSIDLSASGVAIADFPDAKYGDRARVTFDLFDPPVVAEAMVVRTFQRGDSFCAGLCFVGLSPEDRARLTELVEAHEDPVAFQMEPAAIIRGQNTMDLAQLLRQESDAGLAEYIRIVVDTVTGRGGGAPTWLLQLIDELTETERRSLEHDEHEWIRAAVGMRVELRRQLVERAACFEPSAALDLCRMMALKTLAASDQVASDATAIRAQVLRDASLIQRMHQRSTGRSAA